MMEDERHPGIMVWGLGQPGCRSLEAMVRICRANLAEAGTQCDEIAVIR
jgi:hypothetical protein